MKTNTHFYRISLISSQNEKCFRQNLYRKSKHTFCVQQLLFRKSFRLRENVEKYCRAEQVTDVNMAQAHFLLDTQGYKYTHSGCVTLIAFPQQQRMHEHVSMLHYTCTVCLGLRYIVIFTQCTTSYTLTARSLFSLLYDYPCIRMGVYIREQKGTKRNKPFGHQHCSL